MIRRTLYRHVVIPAFETGYKRRKTFSYWRRLEQSQWQDESTLLRMQLSALRDLIRHAHVSVPYYRKLWDLHGLRPDKIQSLDDFASLPLLTKQNIRGHRTHMRSNDPPGRLITKTTGGSTGEPLEFDIDHGSYQRRVAATMRGYAWCGASPGTKQFCIWGVPLVEQTKKQLRKDRMYEFLHRRRVVNSFELNNHSSPRVLAEMNRYRPDVLIGYTSSIDQFARDLVRRGLPRWSPHAIIVGAEKLYDFQRQRIEAVFQAPVYETYGSREFMLIGAECPQRQGFHLTTEHLVVEVLDDDGSPTPVGEVGNVVITDLFNYGMPFIRYVTGDQAIAGTRQCSCGRGLPLLREVRGRRLDVVQSPDGRRTPGEFFPHLIKDFGAVRKFQVVQDEPGSLEVRAVLDHEWSLEDERRLLDKIRDQVGPTLHVKWSPQDEIPLTHFGKHRVVVNNCPTIA